MFVCVQNKTAWFKHSTDSYTELETEHHDRDAILPLAAAFLCSFMQEWATPKDRAIIWGKFLLPPGSFHFKLESLTSRVGKTVTKTELSGSLTNCVSAPVVTSLMSSAALWQPSTSRWVHVDSSLAESTLNTWVSTPCLVPDRRPNERSESRRGELFPGPEWTSLRGGENVDREMRSVSGENEWVCMFVHRRAEIKTESLGESLGRKNDS